MTEIDSVVNGYKTLKLNSFQKVFSSDMSIIKIDVYKYTIEDYCSHLQFMLNAFKETKQLAVFQTTSEVKSVFIREFFIGNNNQNLKPLPSLQLFIQLATEFLDIYQKVEQSTNKSFIIEKNLYLSSGVVSNLIILYYSLKQHES